MFYIDLDLVEDAVENKSKNGAFVLALRRRLGLKQSEFWPRLGLTQSTGSRLENGNRTINRSIRMLISLAYGDDPRSVLKRLRRGGRMPRA